MRFFQSSAMALTATLMLGAAAARAQEPAPMVPPTDLPAPAATASVRLADLWFELLITGGMCGLAIFAVCRSSPRN